MNNVCNILTDVRINSIYLSEYHRNRFYKFKSFSKYFDLPILVISAVSSSFAVGAQPYLSQGVISLVSCATGVIVTVITSVKLYLNINESMNLELKMGVPRVKNQKKNSNHNKKRPKAVPRGPPIWIWILVFPKITKEFLYFFY